MATRTGKKEEEPDLESLRKELVAKFFEINDGSVKVLIYRGGKPVAYCELQPTEFEPVWRFFVYGVSVAGKPFMESGYEEMGDKIYDADIIHMMACAIATGRFADYASKHKVYRVRKETVLRKLAEDEKALTAKHPYHVVEGRKVFP